MSDIVPEDVGAHRGPLGEIVFPDQAALNAYVKATRDKMGRLLDRTLDTLERQLAEPEKPVQRGKIPQAALRDGFDAKILEAMRWLAGAEGANLRARTALELLRTARDLLAMHGLEVEEYT